MKHLLCWFSLLTAIACQPKPKLTPQPPRPPSTTPSPSLPVKTKAPPSNEQVAQLIFEKVLLSLEKRTRLPGAVQVRDGAAQPLSIPSGKFYGIWGAGDDLYIAGDKGKIFRSQDNGASWSEQQSNTDQALYALWGRDSSLLIAAGANGTILTSLDQGASWKPQKSGATSTLRAISGASDKAIFIVGDNGDILFSSDQGNTWKPQKSGVKHTLHSVWASDKGVYTAGLNKILFSSNNGKTWSAQKTPQSSSLLALYGDKTGVYAAGESGDILQLDKKTWQLRSGLSLDLREDNVSWPEDDDPDYDSLVEAIYAEYTDWSGLCVNDGVLYLLSEQGLSTEEGEVSPGTFSSLWCSPSGAVFAVGEEDKTPTPAQLKQDIAAKRWPQVLAALQNTKSDDPYLSIATDIAAFFAGDLARGFNLSLFTSDLSDFDMRLLFDDFQRDKQAHAVLWFFEGERRAALKKSKEAQEAYLASLSYAPLTSAQARANGGPCLAEVSIKTLPFQTFSSLSSMRDEVFKDLPEGEYTKRSDKEIKTLLCEYRPNKNCTGAGPWLYETAHAQESGGEDTAIHALLPMANGSVQALLWLYRSSTDYMGLGGSLQSAEITALSPTVSMLSIESGSFDVAGSALSLARLDIVFDPTAKKQLRMIQHSIPVDVVEVPTDLPGNYARPTPSLFLPFSISLQGESLSISGEGCAQSYPLSSLK